MAKQKEFITAGKDYYERLLMAGNGNGKTEVGAYEATCHLTGEYPDWWDGYRYSKPVIMWCAGETAVDLRDTIQEKLFGPPGDPQMLGTGFIPRSAIIGQPAASRSAPNAFESALVKHKTGGTSRLIFKTYAQNVRDWQGPTIDFIWFDEECPYDLHSEGMARLRGKGRAMNTYTPTAGMTPLTKEFMDGENPTRIMIRMGLKDCPWYTDEQRTNIINQWPPHEREARINGTPMLGEGNVFQTPLDDLLEEPIPPHLIPEHWCLVWGLDFGFDHPFAAVLIAWDKDTDTIHVLHTIRMRRALPLQHADEMKRIAGNAPVAWPHDGHKHDGATSGVPLADIYRNHGLKMLPSHATHPSGGYSTYAGIMGLDEYMRAGRFKVSKLLRDWEDEYRMYHFKDGQIVKVNDDLMSATRIAWMDRRYAKPVRLGPAVPNHRRPANWIRPETDNWEYERPRY